MAAANAQLPAAIRSGTTSYTVGWRASTPSISIVEVPPPLTWAPIDTRKSAMSAISGSRAAFSMVVCPRARTEAMRTFSVAPTLGNSSRMLAPLSPCGAAAMR